MNVNDSKLFYHYFEQTEHEPNTSRKLWIGMNEDACVFDIEAPFNVKLFSNAEYQKCFIYGATEQNMGQKKVNISILHYNFTTLQKAEHTTTTDIHFITNSNLNL